jgi:hypothetical protein
VLVKSLFVRSRGSDEGRSGSKEIIIIRIKALLGLTTAGLIASALVPTAAYADSVTFRFCNISSSDEQVGFPYHSWIYTPVRSPGTCWTQVLSGVANDEAVGFRNVNGQWPAVVTKYFSDSPNVKDPTNGAVVEMDF